MMKAMAFPLKALILLKTMGLHSLLHWIVGLKPLTKFSMLKKKALTSLFVTITDREKTFRKPWLCWTQNATIACIRTKNCAAVVLGLNSFRHWIKKKTCR